MTTDYLENQLANYRRLLLVIIGAAVTLLATALADIPVADVPDHRAMYFPGWYAVWFVLLLAVLAPSVVLLLGSQMRKLPFAERLNTTFGYLASVWVIFLAFALRSYNYGAMSLSTWLGFLTGVGIVFGMVYWLSRRHYINAPEAMFP